MSHHNLEGLRVLVTRASHQAGKLASMLRDVHAEVIELPVISISPPDSWSGMDAALSDLSRHQWILFASVNSVTSVLNRLREIGMSVDALKSNKLAAIGSTTAEALSSAGLSVDFVPTNYVGESLVEQFPGYPKLDGVSILWPRANIGRDLILNKLRQAGATVDVVDAYKTTLPENTEQLAERLYELIRGHQIDLITLASSQSARNLARMLHSQEETTNLTTSHHRRLIEDIAIACIGPETSEAARQAFGKEVLESSEYTAEGLLDCICDWNEQRRAPGEH